MVPSGLAELSPAQQALVEFLEVDPDLLEAACAGSAMTSSAGGGETRRITAWLDTWQTQDMKDVLRRIALGQGQEAERRVKSHYADWLKAQRPSSSANAPRRRMAELRELGSAIISHTCNRTRQLKRTPYDRLFPNQDTLPKGGFGNLIALPLQKTPRERGASVFVDDELHPYSDQWAFLASVQSMAPHDIEPAILRATGGSHPLDVIFVTEEDLHEPWKRKPTDDQRLPGPMPASLTLTLANLVYVEKALLPQALANRLIRLAAFQNPEFHQAQALRFSSATWR